MTEYPINRELKKLNYFSKLRTVYFPAAKTSLDAIYGEWVGGYIVLPEGITGSELLTLRKSLSAEYRLIEKGTGELEIMKRGANEGYKKLD